MKVRIRYCALLFSATGIAFMCYLNALFMVAWPVFEFSPLQTGPFPFYYRRQNSFNVCLLSSKVERERERERERETTRRVSVHAVASS